MSGYVNINPTPNVLFDPMMARRQTAADIANQTNQMLQPYQVQEAQQKVGEAEMDYAARASSALLQMPDEATRAQYYQQVVAEGQKLGFLKNAPSIYPGEARLRQIQAMGVPVEKQWEQAANIAAYRQYSGGGAGTTPPAGAVGPVTPTDTGPIEPDALSRARLVYTGLIKRGVDPDTAAGFAANSLHESSANPNTGAGDGGASHGLFQWRDDRAIRYQKIMGRPVDNAPLDQQLDFVVNELNTTEGAARDRIAEAKGPEAKAAAISQYYLRPKDVQAEMARRAGTARQFVSQLGGQQPPVAPTATAQRTGGTDVAGPPGTVPTPPPGSTAPPQPPAASPPAAPVQVTTTEPETGLPVLSTPPTAPPVPRNGLGPGVSPPPAPPVAPASSATAPPQAPQAQPGMPQPPQLQPLNNKGLTNQQQAAVDALGRSGQYKLPDLIKMEQGYAQQNLANQEKQFNEWIQLQQLQTSQGQLSNAQAETALHYWEQAHPTAKVTLSGGEIITQDPRDGHEIAPRIKVTPNEAPRFVDSQAIWDPQKQTWRKTLPGEQGVPGKWAVGATGEEFFPNATRPATGDYEAQRELFKSDIPLKQPLNESNQSATNMQIRLGQMRQLVDQISTGAGGAERANWANIAETAGLHDLATQLIGKGGAEAAQIFEKYATQTAGELERATQGAKGSGIGALTLYKNANPGLQLQPNANKLMLNAQLIAAQGNRDYSEGALNHVNQNTAAFAHGGEYKPISEFDQQWAAQRNPQIYTAALRALDGDNWDRWTSGLNMKSADDVQRVMAILRRADPTARVKWERGQDVSVSGADNG